MVMRDRGVLGGRHGEGFDIVARAENSPETRDRAPDSFSMRMEMTCLIFVWLENRRSWRALTPVDRRAAASCAPSGQSKIFGRQDHVGQALAALDHRIDVSV